MAYGTGVTKCAATLKTPGPAADISGEREIWILGGNAASAWLDAGHEAIPDAATVPTLSWKRVSQL